MATSTVSAPGKVLLAGGYLILDRAYQGLVFGLDARIHVCVKWTGLTESKGRPYKAVVRSPQFQEAHWVYICSPSEHNVLTYQTDESESIEKNPFVEKCLTYTLTYLHHHPAGRIRDLDITILADDDYYSHSRQPRRGSFSPFGVSLKDAHKTGLGSSAALVTALTGALLAAGLPEVAGALSSHQDTIHNLAQAAHCAAQEKVGSGFDVAAAVYGSCLYRRFSPAVIEAVGEASFDGFGERLHRCVEDLDPDHAWDMEVLKDAVQIPTTLRLVMCDIDCGSKTPGMVRKVLTWKKANSGRAELLWTALQRGTVELCEELKRLAQIEGIGHNQYQNLGDILQTIRSLVQEMSKESGVPIEPPVQTELLDACSALSGVVGGVVPGAGGYDAVVLIIENDSKTLQALENLLDGWSSTGEQGSGVSVEKVRLLGVKQDSQGIRIEPADTCAGWI